MERGESVAIRWRRGPFDKLDLNKLVPGEPVVALDNKYVAVCITPGDVVELASREYMDIVLVMVNETVETANNAITAADTTLQRAEGTVVEAQGWSDMAKSWAIGEGNVREDESSNNSKYFAQRAALEYQNAKNEADRAKQYSSITQPDFLIQDNRLYYKAGTGVQFVTSGNRLYWKITA